MVEAKKDRNRKHSPSLRTLNAKLLEVKDQIAKKLKEDGVIPDANVEENADVINELLAETSPTSDDDKSDSDGNSNPPENIEEDKENSDSQNINADESTEEYVDLDEETLQILSDDEESDKSKFSLHPKLVSAWSKILLEGLKKEKKTALLDKYPTTGNCPFQTPKLNVEIEANVKEATAKRDKFFAADLDLCGSSLAALGSAITMIFNSATQVIDTKDLLTKLIESGKLMCDLHNQLIKARKAFIYPYPSIKSNKKMRFVLNLKNLNRFIPTEHFKMEDFRTATKLVSEGSFMGSIDLKDAYFLIPLHKISQKYVGFDWNNDSLMGCIVAACPAVQYGWLYSKGLERTKYLELLRNDLNYSATMTIPHSLSADLDWWEEKIWLSSNRIRQNRFDGEIFSDSSGSGWGAACNGEVSFGSWNEEELGNHINYLELKAAFIGYLNRPVLAFTTLVSTVEYHDDSTSIGSQDADNGRSIIWEAYKRQGFGDREIKIMMQSIMESTLKQYSKPLKDWARFCRNIGCDMYNPSIRAVASWLGDRAALSLILGDRIGKDPAISRLLKGIYNNKPAKPKYDRIFSLNPVLLKLTDKLVVLLALITAHRKQTISLITIKNIIRKADSYEIEIPQRVKNSKSGTFQPLLILPKFTEKPDLCIVNTLNRYLEVTKDLCKECDSLIITTKKPYKKASRDTISRWIRAFLVKSGISKEFAPHSLRYAATSAALKKGVDLSVIKSLAGWSERPIVSNGNAFAEAVVLEKINKKSIDCIEIPGCRGYCLRCTEGELFCVKHWYWHQFIGLYVFDGLFRDRQRTTTSIESLSMLRVDFVGPVIASSLNGRARSRVSLELCNTMRLVRLLECEASGATRARSKSRSLLIPIKHRRCHHLLYAESPGASINTVASVDLAPAETRQNTVI
ncbi:hypothetical protein TSAR_001823 [Trichomalopsis sarcophagae]|uniref:Tyr recombinase domain-containing protein n=1 Tax=Trichomalopsis sarcophagae TaxID=543379 RepID=A0A232EHY5_9HYME|nr:hypothetical protein TSAR_001823 [Trichomalopsis sarcophagae]